MPRVADGPRVRKHRALALERLSLGGGDLAFVRSARPYSVLALALLALAACGQDDGVPGGADGRVIDGGCAPRSGSSFSPRWRPPQKMPSACTDAQIEDDYRLCEGPSASTAECTAFNRDSANARCRACLYSTEDESSYGPLVYLRNRVLTVNVAGCLALADGNLSAGGCGAKLQAFESCKDAVCIESCATFDAYQQCVDEAGRTVCVPYLDDSSCKDPAVYAACLEGGTFEDFFRRFAKIFCGSGFPGPVPDGGSIATVASRCRSLPAESLRTRATLGPGDGLSR